MLGSRKNFVLLTLLFSFLSLKLHAAALPAAKLSDSKPTQPVYRRYVLVRPSAYTDDEFMEEIVEEFYVQHRPPKFAMSDDDINLIIKCDLSPEFKDCYQLKSKDEYPTHEFPTTQEPSTMPPPFQLQPTQVSPTTQEPYTTPPPLLHPMQESTTTEEPYTVPPPLLPEIPFDKDDEVNETTTDNSWTQEEATTTEDDLTYKESDDGESDDYYDSSN